MVLNAGSLNRRIQIRRFIENGEKILGEPQGDWQDIGPAVSARRRDVSDAERLNAGAWENLMVTRFVIRATVFSRGIRRTDRLTHEGVTYKISGIKEFPEDRGFLEITAETSEAL